MTDVETRQHKRGSPWWVWWIALALTVFLLWQFLLKDQFTPGPAFSMRTDEASKTFTPDVVGEPITSLDRVLTSDAATIVGRRVQLSNVLTGGVPADAGFWIVGAGGRREYVILHEVETPNTRIEGKIDVNEGDRLDIAGTVRSAAEGVPESAAIPGPTAPLPAGVEHYIDAKSVVKTR